MNIEIARENPRKKRKRKW